MPALIRRTANFLMSPALVLWLLPMLIALIAAGTVAQKFVGLYVAEKTYFSSYIFWLGDALPLPGGYTLLGVFALGLLLKFLFKSEWRRARIGINLAHLGVVLLFAGGIISSLMSQDGSMTIAEGATAAQVHDYHQRDLMLVDGVNLITAITPTHIYKGAQVAALPFTLTILDTCRNCSITERREVTADLRSMAKGMQLAPIDLSKTDESNVSGITFRLTGLGADQDGTYILFEDGPTAKINVAGHVYELAYGKSQRTLPFSIELKDFVRTNYPGTDTPQAYHSDVVVHDGQLSWPARIEMNAPLRYRGYTLYQAAFIDTGEKQFTVLSVSHDAGQFIPYLGTFVLALGLLLHLFLRRAQAEQP